MSDLDLVQESSNHEENYSLTPKTNWQKLNACVYKGNENETIAYLKLHPKLLKELDSNGKSSLEIAASQGKNRVLLFIISKGADVNFIDRQFENTPSHYAAIFGNYDTLVLLMKYGADINIKNRINHSALSYLERHHPKIKYLINKPLSELNLQLVGWGSNSNYNLGLISKDSIEHPDYIELPDLEENEVVVQICAHKFHTLFRTNLGHVFVCGHGSGGRLGMAVNSSIIVPQLMRCGPKNNIKMVAAGADHSVFLTKSGDILTCGSNKYKQLGLNPCPENVIEPSPVKNMIYYPKNYFLGVGAGTYHTAFWNASTLWTFGLNLGQLGHPVDPVDCYVIEPRSVNVLPSLFPKITFHIDLVCVSDAAIVLSTTTGYVIAIHQHKIRVINSGHLFSVVANRDFCVETNSTVKMISCIGGSLVPKSKVASTKILGYENSHLIVGVLTKYNKLFVWSEKYAYCISPQFGQWQMDNVFHFALNQKEILYVSSTSFSAFSCQLDMPHLCDLQSTDSRKPRYTINEPLTCRRSRLSLLPRPYYIFSDSKGLNMFATQYSPNALLRTESQVSASTFKQDIADIMQKYTDEFHCDLELKVEEKLFYGHSYILAHYSDFIRDQILAKKDRDEGLILPSVSAECVSELFRFVSLHMNGDLNCVRHFYREKRCSPKRDQHYTFREEPSNNLKSRKFIRNSVVEWATLLQTFQLNVDPKPFHRETFPDLYDVWFECADTEELVGAHKCILMARSPHFEVAFSTRWCSNYVTEAMKMVCTKKVLILVLDYFYTDNCLPLTVIDVDELCEVFIVANEILAERLQEVCQATLISKISIKNCLSLLPLAVTLDAKPLISAIYQFLALNILTFLHNKCLLSMEQQELSVLTEVYKSLIFVPKDFPGLIFSQGGSTDTVRKPPRTSSRKFYHYWHESNNATSYSELGQHALESIDSDDENISLEKVRLSKSYLENEAPTDAELIKALNKYPSVVEETEEMWFQKDHKPDKSSVKKGKSPNAKSRIRKVSSSSTNSENELVFQMEEFTFDDITEREPYIPPDTSWRMAGRRKRNSSIDPNEGDDSCSAQSVIPPSVVHNSPPTAKDSQSSPLPIKDSLLTTIECSKMDTSPPLNDYSLLCYDLNHRPGLFPSLEESFTLKIKKSTRTPKLFPKERSTIKRASPRQLSPWGGLNEENEISLRDVIAMQDIIGPILSEINPKKEKKPSTKFLRKSQRKTKEPKRNISEEPEKTSPKTWKTLPQEEEPSPFHFSPQSPEEATKKTMKSIMEEEIKMSKKLEMALKKPLDIIQLEERAVSEILDFYGSAFNPDEFVTINRISDVNHEPTWKN